VAQSARGRMIGGASAQAFFRQQEEGTIVGESANCGIDSNYNDAVINE
jgi:hypothetical protein